MEKKGVGELNSKIVVPLNNLVQSAIVPLFKEYLEGFIEVDEGNNILRTNKEKIPFQDWLSGFTIGAIEKYNIKMK